MISENICTRMFVTVSLVGPKIGDYVRKERALAAFIKGEAVLILE